MEKRNSLYAKKRGKLISIQPLISEYLKHGYKQENVNLMDIDYQEEKNQIETTWKIENPFPSIEEFHLSAQAANIIMQQTTVVYIMLDMGFEKKEHEVWVNEVNFSFLASITDPKGVKCKFRCLEKTVVKISAENEQPELSRYTFSFSSNINRVFRAKGFAFIEVEDSVVKGSGIPAGTS